MHTLDLEFETDLEEDPETDHRDSEDHAKESYEGLSMQDMNQMMMVEWLCSTG